MLCLVGFMGAGKTSVGRVLASRLRRNFVDLDDLITSRAGKTVNRIFAEEGEQSFRELERQILAAALRSKVECVLSLGGGAYVSEENRAALRATGAISVFLDAPFDELMKRCAEGAETRPLLQGQERDKLRQLFKTRLPAYQQAEAHVDTGGKSVQQVVDDILATLVPMSTKTAEKSGGGNRSTQDEQ